ncbi:THAP domain-containing protein 5-like [Temnothorax americanus]|uniref:THAP domain-containing protein 5-like n=1 Tax=Temnothorax americanus TaxID=1964332 RepID=UPI004067806D
MYGGAIRRIRRPIFGVGISCACCRSTIALHRIVRLGEKTSQYKGSKQLFLAIQHLQWKLLRHEKGFRFFSIPTIVERRKKWLQNLGREEWIPTKSACVCEVHFEDSQFESRRVNGVRKLKPNAVPTLFHVPNSPRRIDSPPRKSPYKKLRSEVAGMCAQKVAEVSITSEMNMDYAAP